MYQQRMLVLSLIKFEAPKYNRGIESVLNMKPVMIWRVVFGYRSIEFAVTSLI